MISPHCTSMTEGGREKDRMRERERGSTVSLYLVLITSIHENQQRGVMALD